MRRLSRLLAIALVLPASAQAPDAVALYIGPLPNPDGLIAPPSKDFADSYADLRKAHIKARPTAIALVDDPAQADAVLTITHRGDVDNGASVGTALPLNSPGFTISSTHRLTPTLQARLTARVTGEVAAFSGVDTDATDRTKWSVQAQRIYEQAASLLIAKREQLIRLRRQE